MHAVVSGRAGVALLFEGGDRVLSIGLDPLAPPAPRTPRDVRFLLGDVRDLVFVKDEGLDAIRQRLADARDGDDALQLTLFLLDPKLSDGARDEAAGALEELLARGATLRFAEAVLHAHPVPASADIVGARASARRAKAPAADRLFATLTELQWAIEEVWRAWEALPPSLFNDEDDRARVRVAMVRAGLFSALARERHAGRSVDAVAATALAAPEVRAIRGHRAVVQAWIVPLRAPVSRFTGRPSAEIDEEVDTNRGAVVPRGAEVFERVRTQQDAIVAAMRARDLRRVRERVEDMVVYQRSTGKPIHVAKSLCYLAAEAQKLGLRTLQDELTERATHECPDDAWSWTQRGKALQDMGRLPGALEAYDRALAFGADIVVKTGRAEVLKAMGRFDDALRMYEEAGREHPENVVAKNGRAEVLKAMGRFDDALRMYEEAGREHPENVVVKNGRAEVLKAMGRFDDALQTYEETAREHPEDVFAKNGRAEVLKAMGRFDDALRMYEEAGREHPENVVAKNGHAEVLKAMGRFDDALRMYEEAGREHPENVVAKTGRAEVLKAMGRFDDALRTYEEAGREHPEDVFAKTGRAEVLKAMGRFDEALRMYEEAGREHPENVVAKNGRAEVLKTMGRFDDALRMYDEAGREHPESVVAKTGRAEVLKTMGRFDDALRMYEEAGREHPENVVAKNGRAEVLKAMGRFDDALRMYEEAGREHPENVVAKTGRAEVLKAMGRFDEALRMYEEAGREHPEDVFAKNGHAEVLKAMGRFDEALRTYEETAREHPENVVAKTGRACILAALGKSREALRSLPQDRPRTADEWIGYHVRGMILLRTGKVDQAIRKFEDGAQNDPSVLSRDYFRTALAVARLRQRRYVAAVEVLGNGVQPRVQPQADMIRVHALGEQGKFDEAAAAYLRLPPPRSSQVRELMDELRRRFVDRLPPANDNDWLIRRQIDAYLLAA